MIYVRSIHNKIERFDLLRVEFVRFHQEVHELVGLANQSRTNLGQI